MKNSFGSICRKWRKLRGFSQLQLAVELDISSKHISFVETGRSNPSREMILKIANFLFLPKREINQALYSAGYAPIYAELKQDSDDLRYVLLAVEQMLSNHEPYPALVLNQYWDVVKANQSAQTLLGLLGYQKPNLIEALIADNPAESKIINWHESATLVLTRLRYEISMLGGNQRLEKLATQLAEQLGPDNDVLTSDSSQAVLSIQLQAPDNRLSFFSMIAQLSAVQDIEMSEYRMELMFPADQITTEYCKQNTA